MKLVLLILIFPFLICGCTSPYEKGKEAFAKGKIQEAQQSFLESKPDRHSPDKDQIEAANAISVLQGMVALQSRQYVACITRANEVTTGEWKQRADLLMHDCDSTFFEEFKDHFERKNYTLLLDCLHRGDQSRSVYKRALSPEFSLSSIIQETYLKIPTIAEINRKISSKQKDSDRCDELMHTYWAYQSVYGNDAPIVQEMEESYSKVVDKQSRLESEIEELETTKKTIGSDKQTLSSLFSLITGISIEQKVLKQQNQD